MPNATGRGPFGECGPACKAAEEGIFLVFWGWCRRGRFDLRRVAFFVAFFQAGRAGRAKRNGEHGPGRAGSPKRSEESRGKPREGRRAGRARWTPEPFKKNRPVGLFGPFDQSRSVNLWTIAGFCIDFMGLAVGSSFDSAGLSCEVGEAKGREGGRAQAPNGPRARPREAGPSARIFRRKIKGPRGQPLR